VEGGNHSKGGKLSGIGGGAVAVTKPAMLGVRHKETGDPRKGGRSEYVAKSEMYGVDIDVNNRLFAYGRRT